MIRSVNPANGSLLKEFEPDSDEHLERKLQLSVQGAATNARCSFPQRSEWLRKAAGILETEKRSLGRMMTKEMGKPITAAVQEVEKCASACLFFAENAARFLAVEHVSSPAREERFVRYDPLGPVLAVMPWNFPFWQVFRFAAPALMAGNAGLLKHASNVPQCALAIERLWRQAGVPEGAFQTLLIDSKRVARVIADRRVMAVTLTGSVEAGRSVAAEAGRCLKKTVLELGGSDPFIVMPSAQLDQAASTAVRARVINNGQSCIAAKRFIVHHQIAGAFQEKFVQAMRALRVGDPVDESTDIGPLATQDVLCSLDDQVQRTVAMGARVVFGGKRLVGPGYYYAPTVLTDIPPDSPAATEELFGPVASLFIAEDLVDAVRIANNTNFGLGACLWSNDAGEQRQFIEAIQSGVAVVNGMVASDPRLPFGGVKDSGYGRELSSHGIREFVNVKAVIKLSV